jgi:ATP-dependent DNA ligase
MTEREIRDLQSILYAPLSDGGRKRKERSGDDDDDRDECLLQYAIKKSRGNDDEDLNDSILQYAIEKSRDGTSSKALGSNFSGWLADSSEDLLEPIREAQRAILRRSSSRPVASPRRALGQQTRSDVSTFALNFRRRESIPLPSPFF